MIASEMKPQNQDNKMINPILKIDEQAPLPTPLNKEERKLYEQHERAIRSNFKAFLDVGERLADIRDRRLYWEEFATFESYCRTRWEMSDRRARQLIQGAEVVEELTAEMKSGTTVPILTGENLVPTTESQARELAKAPPASRLEVMREATQDGATKPTAEAIKEAVAKKAARSKSEHQRISEVFSRVPPELHEKLSSLATKRDGSPGTALHHERAELALAINPNATHNDVDALRTKPPHTSAKVTPIAGRGPYSDPVAPEPLAQSVDRDESIRILCDAIRDLLGKEEREAIEVALKQDAWELSRADLEHLCLLPARLLRTILPCLLHADKIKQPYLVGFPDEGEGRKRQPRRSQL